MKKTMLFLVALLSLTVAAQAATTPAPTPAPAPVAPAAAPAPATPAAAQNNKMKTCAQQYHARGIAKSQYRAFMSACLKTGADPATVTIPSTTPAPSTAAPAAAAAAATTPAAATAPAAPLSQKDKMKACNANAKTQALTGDARQTFMKTCLSN